LPLNEFPLSGYKISLDSGFQTYWRRTFDPLAPVGAEYDYLDLGVTVIPGSPVEGEMRYYLGQNKCEATTDRGGTHGGVGPKSAQLVTAPTVGDFSSACAFAFPDGFGKFDLNASYRNVLIWVQVSPRFGVTQSAALDQAIAIAKRQISVLDRISVP